MLIDFGAVCGAGAVSGIEGVECCEVGEVDGVVAVDGDIGGP